MNYETLVSPENLFKAFDEFKRGKRKKKDVMRFEKNLEYNIFELAEQLTSKTYKHGPYFTFHIYDPKHRIISKARVRDRIVHHILFNYLNDLFDKTFIYHSYSSRTGKGTHLGVENLHKMMRKVSNNFTVNAYALKCDIKKFFANVDHNILLNLITQKVNDPDIFKLIKKVIISYQPGIPLGNLTSQIFANIYLNELDQFIKHNLEIKYYSRYADDSIILRKNKNDLLALIGEISTFLQNELKLQLHPNKIIIQKFKQGIDFLGYNCFPHHRIIRTKTKRRMFRILDEKRTLENFNQSLQSYLGMLKHADSFKLTKNLHNFYFQFFTNFINSSKS